MKRFLVFFWLLLTMALFTIAPPVSATCKKDITEAEKPSFPVQTSFTLSSDEFAKCKPEDTAARGVQPNVSYTVSCQNESEKYSFFSLKAALCGSSDERGPNNATCWTCGGDLRCTGFGQFALGPSDPLIAPPVNERKPVNPGDTNTDQIWRVTGSSIPQGGFTYNGLHYDKPPGDIIVCTSDNRACGASDVKCTGKFPETTPPPGQAAPIVVPGETNFTNISVGKTLKISYDLFRSVGLLDFYLKSFASVKPNEDTLKNPSLENLSLAVNDATSFALKPYMLQQTTVNATNCQQFHVTGRLCVYDKDGKLINASEKDQVVSDQQYQSNECNPTKLNERRQGFEQFAAIATKYTKTDQNYEKPVLDIALDKPLPCDVEDKTAVLPTNQGKSLGQNYFPEPSGSIGKIATSLFSLVSGLFAETRYTIVYKATILQPHEANSWCQSTGCADPTLKRVQYPVDPEVVNGGGALLTAEPYTHDFTKFDLHGGEKNQQFDTVFSPGDVRPGDTAFSYANREKIGGDYFFCMISPLTDNHVGLFPNGECNKDWNRKRPPPPQPNPPNTSTWAISRSKPPVSFTPSGDFAKLLERAAKNSGVPRCVMNGVAHIEGGNRYKELPLDQCLQTTNTCSAVGPMQFTVGPGHGKATEEACKNQCAAGFCPNAWASWGNGGNPCSYADSLSAAGRFLAAAGHFGDGNLQDSVHDAATAYYGSNNNVTARNVLGGCEYWEYVYQHCNSSYVCQANR